MSVDSVDVREPAQNPPGTAAAARPLAPFVLPAPGDKAGYVRAMFDAIAPRYDLLNSLLSARLHHGWRRAAARQANLRPGDVALDVCTGTADLALELAQHVGARGRVIGADFSAAMLRLGKKKAAPRRNVFLMQADALALPYANDAFDAATVAFGIRNVADVGRGIAEMARVVRPGGRVVILEFNQPRGRIFGAVYGWYSFRVLPVLGGWISGRRAAYEYLPSSVAAFHSREAISARMRAAGLGTICVTDLFFGTVVIHCGTKQ